MKESYSRRSSEHVGRVSLKLMRSEITKIRGADGGGKAIDQGERGTAQPVPDTESGERTKRLDRVCQPAKGDPKMRFTALLHQVNIDLLRTRHYNLKRVRLWFADISKITRFAS
jgi:hypothetical protein